MVELRPYQLHQVHAVFHRWRQNFRSCCLVSPTGSGKRLIALWMMEYAAKAGRKVLFVGNRRLLVTQAVAGAAKYDIPHGVIMASHDMGDMTASNQIASIQTLESWHFYDPHTGEFTGLGLPPADLVIIDEVHQDGGRYEQLLRAYPYAKVLGLTATPVGTQGRALVPGMLDVLVDVPEALNSTLIKDCWLLPVNVYAPSEPNIEGVRVQKGEYNQAQLGRSVRECHVFGDVYRELELHGEKRSVVAFAPGVDFARDLLGQLNFTLGAGAFRLITAKTKTDEREEIFAGVEAGIIRGVVSVDVLREGWDCPAISCAIDLQPNQQFRSYWQKVGRIKRPHPGQTEAVYLDFAGNYWRFPHPDEDPEWPIGDYETTQEVIERRRAEGKEHQPIMCPACSFARPSGPRCPACGFESADPIRRIRMGHGRLKEVPAIAKKAVEKTEDERLFGKWMNLLYGALYSGQSYSQLRARFHEQTGEWPRGQWLGVFPPDSLDWSRRPAETYTKQSLFLASKRSRQ